MITVEPIFSTISLIWFLNSTRASGSSPSKASSSSIYFGLIAKASDTNTCLFIPFENVETFFFTSNFNKDANSKK